MEDKELKPYILSSKELFNIFREHKYIDNFSVPIDEIHYITLIDISDISIIEHKNNCLFNF